MKINSELTIILPIYNPILKWETYLNYSIKKITFFLKDVSFKIIIINDGSCNKLTDGITYLSQIYQNIEFVSYPNNKGKGYAIRTGLQKANSAYYIYSDWDFPFGEKAVYNTYKVLKNNNTDVVVSKRDRDYYKRLPLFRRLISNCLHCVNFIFLGFKNIDTQAGLKGLNEDAKTIFLTTKTNGFIFEIEFIKKLFNQHLDLIFLNVHPRKDIHFTNFNHKTITNELNNFFKIIYNNL